MMQYLKKYIILKHYYLKIILISLKKINILQHNLQYNLQQHLSRQKYDLNFFQNFSAFAAKAAV